MPRLTPDQSFYPTPGMHARRVESAVQRECRFRERALGIGQAVGVGVRHDVVHVWTLGREGKRSFECCHPARRRHAL